MDAVRGRLDALVAEVEADYAVHRHHGAQRDFALAVKATRCPAALFAVRAGKAASVREFFATTQIDNVMRTLGLRADDTVKAAL